MEAIETDERCGVLRDLGLAATETAELQAAQII
jgi:hypothetical protein